MKKLLIALSLLLASATAFAAEPAPVIFQVKPPEQSKVQTNIGITQIHTHAANIRIAWLPLLAPLPYSYPRTTQEIPNALVLTGTQIPQRPHHETVNATVTLARR
jgi:hypothetical protein